MTLLKFKWSLVFALGGLVAGSWAAGAAVDASKSSIVAVFTQFGVSVDSPFKKFSGTINYDATQPATASASIDVDMASLDIGDKAYNAEVRKKEWFDSTTFPMGAFRSTAVVVTGPGKFTATGTLTIKGKSQTVTVPINCKASGAVSIYEGSLVISRKAFGIGSPTWEDVVEDKVTVKFQLQSSGK
jgi:polyisoprenoid-binding protein YceI